MWDQQCAVCAGQAEQDRLSTGQICRQKLCNTYVGTREDLKCYKAQQGQLWDRQINRDVCCASTEARHMCMNSNNSNLWSSTVTVTQDKWTWECNCCRRVKHTSDNDILQAINTHYISDSIVHREQCTRGKVEMDGLQHGHNQLGRHRKEYRRHRDRLSSGSVDPNRGYSNCTLRNNNCDKRYSLSESQIWNKTRETFPNLQTQDAVIHKRDCKTTLKENCDYSDIYSQLDYLHHSRDYGTASHSRESSPGGSRYHSTVFHSTWSLAGCILQLLLLTQSLQLVTANPLPVGCTWR